MRHLHGFSDEEVEFQCDIFDIHKKKQDSWDVLAKEYDIFYINYVSDPWVFAHMGLMARKHGVKLVLDVDDALWNVRDDNPSYGHYKRGGEAIGNFSCICNEVDYMTCTNDYLKHIIMNNTTKRADQIKVFPNGVDFKIYNHRSPFKDDGQIRILHFGSSTHYKDLRNEQFNQGIDRIMKEYPNVSIKMVGAFIPQYKMRWGKRYEVGFGDVDIYKWIAGPFRTVMDEADIVVAPLDVDIYNKAKSDIKRSETATALKPFVGQRIRQYEEVVTDGVDGFLCSKDTDWYKALKKLIESPKLRQSMAQKAYERVERERLIETLVPAYADFFKKVLDSTPTKA